MSNEFNHKRRYSSYFMAPLWIALALCGCVLAFLLGSYLVTDEWAKQDKDTLTESPLERAADGVKHDRIEFSVYRNLLHAGLTNQDSRPAAFDSIRDVLGYGGAFADDLKADLKAMAPQVVMATTTNQAGVSAGDSLGDDLKAIGLAVATRQKLDPRQINESKVSCYSADACKDAKTLVTLLRARGYDVRDPDVSSRAEDNSADGAEIMYNAKVIRVALMDPKPTQSAAAPPAPGPKPHPGKAAHRAVKKPVQTADRQVQTADR
jgi:hypothetical protein